MASARNEPTTFYSGQVLLEGVFSFPDGPEPCPGVVLCHPHPLYGGAMSNPLILLLREHLCRAGLAVLRFNFRGVGRSRGYFDHGRGEQADVGEAVSHLGAHPRVNGQPLALVGYSFGAQVGLLAAATDPRLRAAVGVSPPGDTLAHWPVEPSSAQVLLIVGDHDDVVPLADLRRQLALLTAPPELRVVPGADHFWLGHERELIQAVTEFLVAQLQGRPGLPAP